MAATVNPVVLFVRRNAFSVACVALSVLLGGVVIFLVQRRGALESRLQQRTLEGEEMLALLASGPRLREQNTVAREAVARIKSNLIVEANLAENLGNFYEIEEATGARLSELRQLNAAAPEEESPYKVVPYSLQIHGTFEQVASYLYRLETSPRIAKVTTFSMQRRAVGEDAPAPGSTSGSPSGGLPPPPSGVQLSVNVAILGRP